MQSAYAILSSVACRALKYFAHYLINGKIFGGGGGGVIFEKKMFGVVL